MPKAYDILGVICGVLGLCIPAAVPYLYSQRPSRKLKKLEEVIEEATNLIQTVMQEGCVPDAVLMEELGRQLAKYVALSSPVAFLLHNRSLRSAALDHKIRVTEADGWLKQCLAVLKGLSRRIDCTCQDAQVLKTNIAVRSVMIFFATTSEFTWSLIIPGWSQQGSSRVQDASQAMRYVG